MNYRRFFDINDLAGLRVEHPATFRAIHALVARLIAADALQGLRLDHIDGLRDPAQYTRRLQQLVRKLRREHGLPAAFYIIVEKILADGEPMPQLPGVAGTTGYEWLNVISRVLVDGGGLERLEQTWRDFTGERRNFAAMVEDAKLTRHRHHAGERIQRAGARAGAHRRRPFLAPAISPSIACARPCSAT